MSRTIFISYKRDHAASDEVVRALEHTLAADFELLRDVSMKPGKAWSRELYDWLLRCDAGIAVVTDEANGTDWCRREWTVLAARNQTAALPVFTLHVGRRVVSTGILDDIQGEKWSTKALSRLKEQLATLPARVSSAADFLAAHHAWLRWQYNESPVLGREPFSLRDVYIQTECGRLPWGDINEAKQGQRIDAFAQAHGGREDLLEAVLERMADPAFRDLVVAQAGPGSGKSAFTLRLANELMDLGFWPILVRFRDLKLGTLPDIAELIDDAIRIGGSDDQSPHPAIPVVEHVLKVQHELRGTRLCRAVFILDGWDEVSLTGNVTYQAQLKDWLPRLRQYFTERRGDAPVRLVLTGRPSSEVGQSGVLHRATPVFTMRPMRPDQLRDYALGIQRRLNAAATAGQAEAWRIDTARLEPLFADYQNWFDRYVDGKDGGEPHSTDVLGNPLLAYLSLRVVAESDVPPAELLSEPTALYHALIDATVRHAGKGQDGRLEDAVHRGGERLRRLLHEVASTISILRGESVSYTEMEERFKDRGLPIRNQLLSDWANTEATESALRELVVNFYFKGGNTALGCEFLHKSFREYLFAEAIVFALEDALRDCPERDAGSDAPGAYARDFREGTAEFAASRRLAYLLAPQWMSRDVERHVTWLIRRAAGLDPARWNVLRDLATEIYAWWAEGVHLRHQASGSRSKARWNAPFVDEIFAHAAPFDDPDGKFIPVRTPALDAHLGHALMRIANVLHREATGEHSVMPGRRARYQSQREGRFRFCPGANGFMHALMARIAAEGWSETFGLSGLVSGAVDLSRESLFSVYAVAEELEGACFDDASMYGAELSVADLRSASFRRTGLSGARLGEASCQRANFEDANLHQVMASGADFRGASLRGASLSGADLSRANLKDADLEGASLFGANLQFADLTRARVSRAALVEATGVDQIIGKPNFIGEPKPKERRST